jgi:hypothetical protein
VAPADDQISPEADVLPVRANYELGGAWNIGVNPLSSERPLWFALPDVVASTLLSGRPPEVIRAIRLIAGGQQLGLRPVFLRGEVRVDPAEEDFFRVVIQERYRLSARTADPEAKRLDAFLKVLANAASYGIYAEIVRHELSGRKRERVHVYREDGSSFRGGRRRRGVWRVRLPADGLLHLSRGEADARDARASGHRCRWLVRLLRHGLDGVRLQASGRPGSVPRRLEPHLERA